jgi:hypothetical protein
VARPSTVAGRPDPLVIDLRVRGSPRREQHGAFLALIGHIRSQAEFIAGDAQGPSAERCASFMTEVLREHRQRYPALAAAIPSCAFRPSQGDSLAFGLNCILDGIESLLTRRRT